MPLSPTFEPRAVDVVTWSTLLLLFFAGTIFCEFLRFGKNRKNKYPQNFLPTHLALWCMYNHKLRDVCHFGTCIIILFWSFLPFFTSFPCHHELAKVTFGDIDRGSFTSKRKLCSYWITGARCTIWHFSRKSIRVGSTKTTLQQVQSRLCLIY